MLRLFAALIIATFAFASSAPPAQATDTVTALSAAKKKQRHAVRRGGGQIACTIYGCHRIPRHCTPTTEYDFWGNPTGFDAVACR
jgi:hypothetical protein